MPTYSPTEQIVLLVAFQDESGIMRFPSDDSKQPGLLLSIDRERRLEDQVIEQVSSRFAVAKEGVRLEHAFQETLAGEEPSTLFLCRVAAPLAKDTTEKFGTLPELMRKMEADRKRLPYLKAMQFFAGGDEDNLAVVDAEQLAKHLNKTPFS